MCKHGNVKISNHSFIHAINLFTDAEYFTFPHSPVFTFLFLYFAFMIAFVRGSFVQKSPALVQVDVNGVGYEVQISLNTYSSIENLQQGLLHTYLHIREDAHVLYGFADLAEKELFIQLIAVNG